MIIRAIACVAGGIGGESAAVFLAASAGAAKSLGAGQIEIFPRGSYPARNNPAGYASYPYSHPISSTYKLQASVLQA